MPVVVAWRPLVALPVALLLAALMTLSSHAQAPLVVVGTGRASIQNGRALDARARALEDSYDQAVLSAASRLTGIALERIKGSQKAAIQQAVAGLNAELVIQREVVGEVAGPEEYSVTARFSFREKQLRAVLAGVDLQGQSGPRALVAIVIDEPAGRRVPASSIVETELQSALLAAGFRVVDVAQVTALRDRDRASLLAQGLQAAALAVGRRFGADLVMQGTATCDPLPRNPLGFASRVRLDVRLYHTDTGEIVAAEGLSTSAVDGTTSAACRRAFSNAAQDLGVSMSAKYRAWSASKEETFQIVVVHVSGLPYVQYPRLCEALDRGIPGLHGYRLRSHDERAEWIEMEAEFEGQAGQLANAIATSRIKGFRLSVNEVTPNRIQLKAGPE